jgi:hypothetical protein
MASGRDFTLFKGKEQVLKAYEFNKVPAWAIFVDRIPLMSYKGDDLSEGEAMLSQAIDNLTEGMGNGIFQLRVYEEVGPKGILNVTPFNYGFKFALLDDEQYQSKNGGTSIAGLQKRIEELEAEQEEQDNTAMGRIGRFLDSRPDVMDFLMQKAMGIVNNFLPPKNGMPANMAGFTTMNGTQQAGQPQATSADLYNALPPEEKQNFDQAAYILMANDPKVGTHLMKLATLLINNPAMYQSLTKM